jgi:hypothetical protein
MFCTIAITFRYLVLKHLHYMHVTCSRHVPLVHYSRFLTKRYSTREVCPAVKASIVEETSIIARMGRDIRPIHGVS